MDNDTLSESVIGLAIEVHRTLGPGLLENVYETCLCQELSAAGAVFQRQRAIPVIYKGTKLDTGYRADLVVADELLIEIKAVEKLLPLHEAQVLSYLRLGGFHKGLLINFNTRLLREGLRRYVI